MPEVILPCPASMNDAELLKLKHRFDDVCQSSTTPELFELCRAGSHLVDSIRTLPRALTWTTEPPKVAGWYWRKETAADRAHVFHFTGNWEDYGERWESDRVCQLPLILNDNLWAGPIPAPID